MSRLRWATDIEELDLSPAEQLLMEAQGPGDNVDYQDAAEGEVVHRPWEPTGDESPKLTIEADRDSVQPWSVPPPQTAGGSIPSAFARFRHYDRDSS